MGRFVVDNEQELKNLDAVTNKLGLRAHILFRVNPGIEAHTHEFIQTGKIDSKFGIALDQVDTMVKAAEKMKESKRLQKFPKSYEKVHSQRQDQGPQER